MELLKDWFKRSFSDPQVVKYIDRPVAQTLEDAQKHILRMKNGIERDAWILWAIVPRQVDQLVGTICLWNFSREGTTADLGIELLPDFQGQGIMQEALRPVLQYGFNQLDLETIEAYTHEENVASIRFLERNGFHFQKKIREKPNYKKGGPILMAVYALDNPSDLIL